MERGERLRQRKLRLNWKRAQALGPYPPKKAGRRNEFKRGAWPAPLRWNYIFFEMCFGKGENEMVAPLMNNPLPVAQYTPPFSVSDFLKRPANTTAYSANKSINCNLTVTGVAYTLKAVTLTSAAHGLAVGDRITV